MALTLRVSPDLYVRSDMDSVLNAINSIIGTGTAFPSTTVTGLVLISGGAGAPTWSVPTQGSLLFAGGSGILAQNNANLFWDNTALRLGLGTNTPNAATLLHMSSTTKGFLSPQMTTTQRDAIASPPEGLEIYNLTTHRKNYYNGTVWVAL